MASKDLCELLLGGAFIAVLGGAIGGIVGYVHHQRKKSASGQSTKWHEVMNDVYWGFFWGALVGLALVVVMYYYNLINFRSVLERLLASVGRGR